MLRVHMERFGTGQDGRLVRSENGTPIQPSTSWRVWAKTRALALIPAHLATPLMRRPYDLRHSRITWRLNSGGDVFAWDDMTDPDADESVGSIRLPVGDV